MSFLRSLCDYLSVYLDNNLAMKRKNSIDLSSTYWNGAYCLHDVLKSMSQVKCPDNYDELEYRQFPLEFSSDGRLLQLNYELITSPAIEDQEQELFLKLLNKKLEKKHPIFYLTGMRISSSSIIFTLIYVNGQDAVNYVNEHILNKRQQKRMLEGNGSEVLQYDSDF